VDRRSFVALGSGAALAELQPAIQGLPRYRSSAKTVAKQARQPVLVRAGFTRRPDGSEVATKDQQTVVRSFDSEGRLAAFVVPVGEHKPYVGAPLHLHHEQDEWIFIVQGEFVAEVGGKRIRLRAGDALLMPMRIPHRWSVADTPVCGAIHLYTPAGLMDLSWDPSPDDDRPHTPEEIKASFEKYGMTLLGTPLTKEEIIQTIYERSEHLCSAHAQ
jgi:mannose-6-phosphate isomerase-like protein (cupin superfamily)